MVLFVLMVGSVCGEAAAEKQLVYVTVVSTHYIKYNDTEDVFNSAASCNESLTPLTNYYSTFLKFCFFFANVNFSELELSLFCTSVFKKIIRLINNLPSNP